MMPLSLAALYRMARDGDGDASSMADDSSLNKSSRYALPLPCRRLIDRPFAIVIEFYYSHTNISKDH